MSSTSIKRAGRLWAPWAVALAFFLGLAVFETYPLVLCLRTHIPSDLGDPLLNTWILAWDVHALGRGNLRHLFDANIFYPVTNALAFSEHMLGVVPLFAPAAMLTGAAVGGYNVVFLLSFALSGFTMFLLVSYWTRTFWPSLVAGVLFGMAPFRLGKIGHLQILNFFWTPLALLCLDHFLRTLRWRSLMGFALFYWLQVLSSVYLAHMVTIAVVLYTGYFVLVVDRTLVCGAVARKAMAFVAGSIVVLVPPHLPYLAARRDWGLVRTLDETMTYTPDVLSYLSAPPFMNRLYLALFRPIEQTAGWEKWLFPGLVLPALAVIGTFGAVAGIPSARRRQLRQAFGLISVTAIVLSLGPYLVAFGVRTGIPMPYLWLYQSIPGFAAMRVPGRFTMLVLCAAVPLAGLGVMRCSDAVRRHVPPLGRSAPAVTSLVIVTLFLLELGWNVFPLVAIPGGTREPEVYPWLAAHRPGPIVELPFGFFEEYQYLYFSTTHWLPLANGTSGFGPPTAGDIREALGSLPAPSAVEYAQALGIRAIVVHTARLLPDGLARWSDPATARSGLTRVAELGSDRVYSVPPVQAASSVAAEVPTPGFLPIKKSVRLALVLRSPDGV